MSKISNISTSPNAPYFKKAVNGISLGEMTADAAKLVLTTLTDRKIVIFKSEMVESADRYIPMFSRDCTDDKSLDCHNASDEDSRKERTKPERKGDQEEEEEFRGGDRDGDNVSPQRQRPRRDGENILVSHQYDQLQQKHVHDCSNLESNHLQKNQQQTRSNLESQQPR